MQFKVKFCGFTNAQDVIFAHGLGIHRAGIIFAPKSKRHNQINSATQDWLSKVKGQASGLELVAVVAGLARRELETLLDWNLFSYFQFNWDLTSLEMFFSKELEVSPGRILDAQIQGIWLSLAFDNLPKFLERLDFWREKGVRGVVLDSLDQGHYGGTGKAIEVSPEKVKNLYLLRNLDFITEISLAGGLNPANLEDIIQSWTSNWQHFLTSMEIAKVRNFEMNSSLPPFTGIDLAGGIEKKNLAGPPLKDPELMKAFMQIMKKIEKRY
jgi:phosphoribosylanthranilate isomerase